MRDWSIGREPLEFATNCPGLRAVAFETASTQPQITANTQDRMSWLTESPGLLVAVGVVSMFLLIFTLFYAPSKRLAPLFVIAGLLIVVPLVVDALVDTDGEQLKRIVRKMAQHVRQNDIDGLLRYVHPDAANCRSRIERDLPYCTFSACNVTGFQPIEFEDTDPPTAKLTLKVFVIVNAPQYNNHNGVAWRIVWLKFQHFGENGWLLTGFRHEAAFEEF